MDTLITSTKDYITQTDLLEFYKVILENQSNSYSNLIVVLLGITAFLVGSTWLWNFFIARQQIKSEVLNSTKSLTQETKDEFEKIITKRFSDLEESIDKKLKRNEANLARLYAVNCSNQELYVTSIRWWIGALKLYKEIEDDTFLRTSVDSILENLKQPNWFNNMPEDFDVSKNIQEIEQLVPDLLKSEKKQIIKILKTQQK